MTTRRFEFAEEGFRKTLRKFWEIEVKKDTFTTRWGRRGTEGQSKTKKFKSAAEAKSEANKLISEKTQKGYEEILPATAKAMKKLLRTAYKPITSKKKGTILDSKFGGLPWLRQDEEWPKCANCQKPLQLFLQLNLATLPEELNTKFGKGLLQVFYCTSSNPHCEVQCESWGPYAKSVLTRRILPSGQAATLQKTPESASMQCKIIVKWKPIGAQLPKGDEASQWGVPGDDVCQFDQLWGWPSWVQSVDYPSCRKCKSPMQLVMQIEGEQNLNYGFGDSGNGHLTQCPKHKEELAFAWGTA